MTNAYFHKLEDYKDIESIQYYTELTDAGLMEPDYMMKCLMLRSRDNARTPMQWDGSEKAGFTDGEPWIKINPNCKEINAASQLDDLDSIFHYYQKLIALRKDPEYKETVVYGALEPFMEDRHNLMAYYRKGDKTLLVVGNYQWEEQEITLPSECKKVLINNYPDMVLDGNSVKLHGYQVLVVELA